MKGSVGPRIREARQRKGWTQHELAAAIHQHPNSVSRWERGGVRPSIDVLALIAEATDTSADFLLGLIPEPRSIQGGSRS